MTRLRSELSSGGVGVKYLAGFRKSVSGKEQTVIVH